ncbi:hypothetical protein K469DRAFT_584140 [Zopfia rhizophila CBS 207.26]|uniref:Uncharacterized protein n=1 Tax=Zopfia rhizophila CBS 207.26 TaxID=1314779 RepID=A0A6A6DXR9_9PEZI|nr:hypothetical protein K469DRAFT_584140 [Zopfia rhizophila CBS 207.26]
MAPSKVTDRAEPAVVTSGAAPPLRASRLPPRLRIPILVVLSLSLRSALLPIATSFLGEELGNISKKEDDLLLGLFHLAYKILVLWLGWTVNYDFLDISSLTLLTNAPFAYLVTTFYQISPLTVGTNLAIEVISTALPTFLLRPRSKIHNPKAPLYNRFLLNSFQVQATTTLLAIGVYVVVLWSSLKIGAANLNTLLVSHFDVVTLEDAHAENPLSLVTKTLLAGLAAQAFLLNPSLGAQPGSGAATPVAPFDPATSTLSETIQHNVWFYSKRTKMLIRQTAILSAFLLVNTIHRVLTLEGTDVTGAVGYAGIWIFTTVVYAGWLAWVGDTET